MDTFILPLLRCPTCKKPLRFNKEHLSCQSKHNFKIVNRIPVLIDLEKIPTHLKKQIEYFENEDTKRLLYTLEPWQKRYVDTFLRFARLSRGALIIDNATGSGYIALELARRGYHVLATDLTLRELQKLRVISKQLRLDGYIHLVCCTSEALPIQDNIAQGLVANAILEHLPREKEAIEEISRVTRKRAIIMVAMPLAYRYIFPFFWPLNWIHDRRIGHLRRYTRGVIIEKFSKFREVYTYYTGGIIKVICSVLFILTKSRIFLQIGEWSDLKIKDFPYGASNIVSILQKK